MHASFLFLHVQMYFTEEVNEPKLATCSYHHWLHLLLYGDHGNNVHVIAHVQ